MDGLPEGWAAVVTGVASGIGRATDRTFADPGAGVVVADVGEEPRRGGLDRDAMTATASTMGTRAGTRTR